MKITYLLLSLVLILLGVVVYLNSNYSPPMSESSLIINSNIASDNSIGAVEYLDGITGYLARPETEGKYPALILIHEWWGLNDDIKSIADRFALEGYVALAVDLYDGQVTEDSSVARTLSSSVRDNVNGAFENLEGAISFLRSRDDVNAEKLASVGWCFGGGWSYQMALNGLDIDASIMYYGQFNPDDDFSMMRSDILGHFGENDASIAIDSVRELQAKLNTANGDHAVFIYPNVGHGFANVRGGTNIAYSEADAELAWDRTRQFLESHLQNR